MRCRFTAIMLVVFAFISVCTPGETKEQKRYDSRGNLREINYYRDDGTLEHQKKYDSYNHLIAESYYDGNGKLKTGVDGWAAITWKYIDGKVAEESYYGADGRLTERKQYNDSGDLVRKKYVGDNIDPNEEYSPSPTLAGETESFYDSYGRPEGETSVTYDDPWDGGPFDD